MQQNPSLRYKFLFVLLLMVAVLGAFLTVIQNFLLDTLLAAIFAGVLYPFYKRVLRIWPKRRNLAAGVVVGVTILVVALPVLGMSALIGNEALTLSKGVVVWAEQTVREPNQLLDLIPNWLASHEWVQSAIDQIRARIGDVIRIASGFLSRSVSSATQGAIDLFLHLFVIFFGVFYFLVESPKLVRGFIKRVPLERVEAQVLVDKALLITTATLTSIVVVGVVQGSLIGIAFAVLGLGQPWFWGAVVAMLSAIPALGAPIVYVPAAIYLLLTGQTLEGIGLAVWGAAVVGVVDNILRLYIVGRGAALPDFLVFISSVGGLIVLGAPGLLIGPVLAGLLLGVLDLYQLVLESTGISNDVADEAINPNPAAATEQKTA